jgi:hypothetical protein
MEFLRKNLFMVLLVTITLLLVVVLLIWGMDISDRIETEEMAKRKALSSDINALQRGPYVNRGTIEADTEQVAVVRKALADVRRLNREYNSRDYDVAQLKLLTGQTRPALPFSAKVWDDNQLYFRFVSEYHHKLEELLTRLNATTPPKEEDIFAEAIRQQSSIDLREMIRQKNAPVGVPGAGVGEMPDMGRRAGMSPVAGKTIVAGKRINPDTGHEENITVGEEALKIAQTNLKLHQAIQGQIYADEVSLDIDPQYPKGGGIVGTIPPEKIWDIQVGLWVQSDVIDVIGRTIQDVMSTPAMKGKRPGVINSPIKKLVQIRVTPISSTESISKTTDSTRRGGMMYDEMMMERPGGRSRRSRSVDRYAPRRQLPKAETLTRNVSNQLYDVVRYQFTVLMPTRYLPILERNLARQNYHIILNEEISKVGAPIGEGLAKTPVRPTGQPSVVAEDSLYYYGTEPIRQITISAELLLLTEWVRGTYDAKEEKWIRPPLMPVEVMKKILSPAALRPEDRELIEGKLPTPWRNPSTYVTSKIKSNPQ